ncbi:MAG: amino acid decarboxylase [Clostridia bacterium]|nr:amino acid decarboxylase [Clostridia bacterium]
MIPTPICDFVRRYAEDRPARLHMPGHKGRGPLGFERLDITEIDGADNLYAPEGIIAESEANASRLFGARTFYSAEGSSLAIRAMLALALSTRAPQARPVVLAGRNAHRAFLSAAALLDFDVDWLHPAPGDAYHSCTVAPEQVDAALARLGGRCAAVYLTSPDYLGHLAGIAAIAAVCRRRGTLLLVDNAHGAYLRFLSPSLHPMDLGADMCCDSAHKTLPAVTGAAYLHLRHGLPVADRRVKEMLALFGSSSPSYLILQSLDACNPCLEGLPGLLADFLPKLEALKRRLTDQGWVPVGNEPMKLTLAARASGWTGDDVALRLMDAGIYCEFHDPDFVTLMPTPWNDDADLERLEAVLADLSRPKSVDENVSGDGRASRLRETAPAYRAPKAAMSVREAAFAPRETLPAAKCAGRVLAAPALSCPPCVPIAVCGEVIDESVLCRLRYYGIETCDVVK